MYVLTNFSRLPRLAWWKMSLIQSGVCPLLLLLQLLFCCPCWWCPCWTMPVVLLFEADCDCKAGDCIADCTPLLLAETLCMALRFIFEGDKTIAFAEAFGFWCIFFAAGDEERNLGLAPLKPLCPLWWYWLLVWSGLLNGTDTLGFRGGTPESR